MIILDKNNIDFFVLLAEWKFGAVKDFDDWVNRLMTLELKNKTKTR